MRMIGEFTVKVAALAAGYALFSYLLMDGAIPDQRSFWFGFVMAAVGDITSDLLKENRK